MSFNEDNEELMREIGQWVSLQVPKIFPLEINGAKLNHAEVGSVKDEVLFSFVDLTVLNLDELYIKHTGNEFWVDDKEIEVQEPGLVYVWYNHGDDLVGFLSMKVCLSDKCKVLYLYEIQLSEKYMGRSYGSKMMDSFHKLASLLKYSHYEHTSDLAGTSLTVFPDNYRPYQWYRKQGYDFAPDSPRDRTLRNGTVIQPDHYFLHRPLSV